MVISTIGLHTMAVKTQYCIVSRGPLLAITACTFSKNLDVCLNLNIHMVTPSWWMLCGARAAIQGLPQSSTVRMVLMVKSTIGLHTMAIKTHPPSGENDIHSGTSITSSSEKRRLSDGSTDHNRVGNANGRCFMIPPPTRLTHTYQIKLSPAIIYIDILS